MRPSPALIARSVVVGFRAAPLIAALACLLACATACSPSAGNGDASSSSAASSQSSSSSSPDGAPPLPVVRDDSTSLLFSFVDAGGRVLTVPSVAAVPEPVRKRVLVVDLDKTPEQRQAHRYAFFADLSAAAADGSYPVVVVSRYDPTQQASAAALPAPDGAVIVYSAAWCGYCKKAKAWMTEHDVPFLERDVEKTAGAAAEVAAKLKAAGIPGGGVPVVDWGGSVVVGYDLAAFHRLLTEKPPTAR